MRAKPTCWAFISAAEIDIAGVPRLLAQGRRRPGQEPRRAVQAAQGRDVTSRAVFEDSRTLRLPTACSGASRTASSHRLQPDLPPTLALQSPRVMDSAAALRLEELPKSLLVVGGGYIGLELGYVYAALGSQGHCRRADRRLAAGVDRDLVRPLQTRLATLFDKILVNTKVVKIEETKAGIRATLEGEEVTEREPTFDRVLVSVGRRPTARLRPGTTRCSSTTKASSRSMPSGGPATSTSSPSATWRRADACPQGGA